MGMTEEASYPATSMHLNVVLSRGQARVPLVRYETCRVCAAS